MVGEKPKALQTFVDLEVARCNERWSDIPELTRRYKKYHPYESVLDFTARMEAEFMLLVRQTRSELVEHHFKRPSSYTFINNVKVYGEELDLFYQLDDPNNISMSPRIDPSHGQLILARLLDVIQRQIKTGELETPDDWQAQFSKIILARIFYETGRYDKALEWLQNLALRLEDVETGYGLVLFVQARVIKGVCYECQENYTEALESYFSALRVVESHPEEQNRALAFWIEDCLYRSILLHLRRKGPVKQTLKLMRTYLQYCVSQWPNDWRICKRWIIFRHYIRYLTRAYQKGVYVPSSPDDEYTTPLSPTLAPARSVFSDPGEVTLFERSAAALEETMQLMNQFRSLLSVFAQQLHDRDPVDLKHRTLEYSNLLFSAHDTVGWGTDDYVKRIHRYLARSRKFTFNSICTTRHLFNTLLRLHEYQEAKAAFTRYLELVGISHIFELANVDDDDVLEEIAEKMQNKLDMIVHDSQTSATNNLDKLEKCIGQTFDKKKPALGSCESEMEFDVVKVILAAIHQLYTKQGHETSVLSELAVALLEESEHLKRKKGTMWKSLMISSRRAKGSSYGLYASQCQDPKLRAGYLSESLSSYKRASELDPRSWQTFYELGLQQAHMGDMNAAATSVKRSIKLRSDYIPSWHLLALVQSSRQFHALPKSLQIIQAGLGYHLNMIENFDNEDQQDQFSLSTEDGQEFFARAHAYIKIRMTQVYILEKLEGADAVVKVYPDLLDMYSKLSKRMRIDIQQRVQTQPKPVSVKSSKSTYSKDENDDESSLLLSPVPTDDQSIASTPTNDSVPAEEKKEEKKQRKSFHISNLDDPLISLPSSSKKKKQQLTKEKSVKKPGFLSIRRNTLLSSTTDLSSTKKDSMTMLESMSTEDFKLSESTIQLHNQRLQSMTSPKLSSMSVAETTFTAAATSSIVPEKKSKVHLDLEEQWSKILVEIWTMIGSTYVRAHRYEEAWKAFNEADQLTQGQDGNVWHLIGWMLSEQQANDRALDAYKRGLAIDSQHVAIHISLASLYLDMGQDELAEQLLENTTKGLGWNQPEAWFLLGRVYKKQDLLEDARYSLMYALKLSEVNPIRSLDDFPRFV